MCRAGSSLAAHMLGYTGKTLVWWEIGEKGPYSRYFSRVSCLFLLGSCGCKSDLERERHLVGKVGTPPTLRNCIGGYSRKTLVVEKCGTEHWRKNAPFHEKLAFFWCGRFSCCITVGPKVI